MTRSLSASRASSAASSPRWSPEPEDILGVEALPPSGRGSPVSSAKGSPREAERRPPSGRRERSVSVVSVHSDAEYGVRTRSRSRAASEEPRAALENPEAAKPAKARISKRAVFAEDKEMRDAEIAAAAADDADRMLDVEQPAEAAAQTKRKKRAGTPVAKVAEEDKPKVEPLRPPAKRVNAMNPLEEVCCGNGHLIYNTSGGVDVYANYQPGCAICANFVGLE
jgi:hypothetical protein